MENIRSAADLKLAIEAKQLEHAVQGQLLERELIAAFESLRPLNILKNTLQEVASSPYLVENVVGTVTALASGYISRKIAVGTSRSLFRKIVGAVLQFGVTNLLAQNPERIKFLGKLLVQKIFCKKRNL
jgi:hypothetical protein